MNVELALKINRLVHEECQNEIYHSVPHDIGIKIMLMVEEEQAKVISSNPLVSVSLPFTKCKCGQNSLPYTAHIEIQKCSRCGNDC